MLIKDSEKMYKDRLRKWELNKYNKEQDMLAIRRIADHRGAIGKRTSFRVAGKALDMKEVERYLKRKKKVRGMRITLLLPRLILHIGHRRLHQHRSKLKPGAINVWSVSSGSLKHGS